MPTILGTPKLGTATLGPPLQPDLAGRPLLAKLYDFNGVFKKSLGPLLTRPSFKWTLNAGGHPIEILLPAQDTSAQKPVTGDQVWLQESGGDGSIRYRGLVEDVPDELAVTVKHSLMLQPMVTELGNAAVNKNYSTATDVAVMVRDAVNATSHLTWDAESIPLTGLTAFYYFVHTTALDVLHVARQLAGVNYWWFVDRTGKVWFQAFDSSRAVYTLKRGQDYRAEKTTSSIANRLNHLVVVGAVPPQGSAPITSTYDGASQSTIGVRAAKTPYVYKTVSDQGTLDAIRDTLGSAFDRQLTKVSLTIGGNFPQKIELGQAGGATARYWAPAANPMSESEVGTGAYSPNYVVLEATDDLEKPVILGDIPINGIEDLKYEVDRIIQRTALDSLIYTPGAFTTQVNTIIGGGMQTANDPAPGVPSVARWKLDAPAFRAFRGDSIDRGLPDGAGETIYLGSNGLAYLAELILQSAKTGARFVIDTLTDPNNPILQVFDPSGVVRVEAGSLLANGVSGAQWGFRANDASHVPIFDSLGLISVMKALLTSESTGQTIAGVAGAYPQWQTLRSSTFTIQPGRTLNVLLVGMVTANEFQTAVAPIAVQPNIRARIVGQKTVLGGVPVGSGTVGTATMIAMTVPALAAGTYTADLAWATLSSTNDSVTTYDERLYVFQLGS